MHLLNVSAGIDTLNPMLFEPEKYTKHSRGVIQPETPRSTPQTVFKRWFMKFCWAMKKHLLTVSMLTTQNSVRKQTENDEHSCHEYLDISPKQLKYEADFSVLFMHTSLCTHGFIRGLTHFQKLKRAPYQQHTHTHTHWIQLFVVGIQVSVQGCGSNTWSPSPCFGSPRGYTNHDFTPRKRVSVCKSFMEPCWCLPVDFGLSCTSGSSLCESARGLLTRWMVHCVWSLCVHTAAVWTHVKNDWRATLHHRSEPDILPAHTASFSISRIKTSQSS